MLAPNLGFGQTHRFRRRHQHQLDSLQMHS